MNPSIDLSSAIFFPEMAEILRTYCNRFPTRREAAWSLDYERSTINNLLCGKNREMSETMAEQLGYRRVTVYVPIEGAK